MKTPRTSTNNGQAKNHRIKAAVVAASVPPVKSMESAEAIQMRPASSSQWPL